MGKQHTEKTSAADKIIGFDFQYYYFLLRLLMLSPNETVGFEILDDVHTELANNRQVLVQLKHTTKTKVDGSPKNLTTLDIDLWKSLCNWCLIITDKNAERTEKNIQLDFIKKTDFLLVSNKAENDKNVILNEVQKLQVGKCQYSELLTVIQQQYGACENDEIKKLIQQILDLEYEVGEAFFKNLHFDLEQDSIIQKCKNAVKAKMVSDNKIDSVFTSLDSQIRQDNFIAIREKRKIIISFEDFHRKYRRHFDKARNEELEFKPFTGSLPARLVDQVFIKQLLDIGDIQESDHDYMADYTRYKLRIQNHLEEWYQEGELTESEIKDFNDEAKLRWKNKFREVYRNCPVDEISKKAQELVDAMRKEKLAITSQVLPTDMCNGQYYCLSDRPELGWHKDWDKKFT